ncbi:MAG: UDP-3-O-(3-hydroxymyristoyl)glucosamine N-acyltransferase [Candidatus Neomarinimicrobiota bacterium]|nr:MAG: UDP-3-O-(3-hydroxymyristoyl)glucosamine N-acyltransferase [bacterium]|tara:strand:- start:1960 stop:2967 length:1008 start_codon:yes stop_codon:yes gene_type:complete
MASLKELGALVDAKVIGNSELFIDGVSSLDDGKPSTISYLYSKKYEKFLKSSEAAAVVVSDESLIKNKDGLVVDEPRLAFVKILEFFSEKIDQYANIDKTAQISSSSIIGSKVNIGANVVIGKNVIIKDNVSIGPNSVIDSRSTIGKNTKIFSNIHLYQDSIIGSDCIIHSGVVIGADGYGFISLEDDHIKIPQLGKVVIGNNVEIGANSTIDCGTIGDTLIGDMCKLDNGVQIGHNVSIGRGCLLTAHVTIAGSTKIGEFCAFGGQAGAVDNVTIGDKAIFACYTAVTKDLPGGKMYSGAPAREIKEKNKRDAVYFDVERLKKRLTIIEDKLKN